MMKELKRTLFGNPILRKTTRQLSDEEITSEKIQTLIANMRHTLLKKKLGIGLAAPQIGESIALAVIAIRQTPHRPQAKEFDLVLINPEVIKVIGRKKPLWEGCLSSGSNGKADLFAKVPRYQEVKISYIDENGVRHIKTFKGLQAHVIQHEIDHLNGVLFVDLVKDTKTFMTFKEYEKRIVGGRDARS